MKAWGKRMIWFFGINIIWSLHNLVHFIIYAMPSDHGEYGVTYLLIWWAIMLVPLIFMEND